MRYKIIKGLLLILGLIMVSSPVVLAGASPQSNLSFIGVCSQLTRETGTFNPYAQQDTLLRFMNLGNLSRTRTGFKWRLIHPDPDTWDWRITDSVVAASKANNVDILALISSMPRHVFEAPEDYVDLWLEYVDSLSLRYKEDIHEWELWNEPNGRAGKYWPKGGSRKLFATYIREAALIIRRNQPEATIILGGLTTGKKAEPFAFWRSLFELDILDVVDGIAYHPYQYSDHALVAFNEELTQLIAEYTEDEKELWITEFGVPGFHSKNQAKFSYDDQRKRIAKTLLTHWAMGGSKFYIYNLWDKGPLDPGMNAKELRSKRHTYFGLLDYDMRPKSSFIAIKWISDLLETLTPVSIVSDQTGTLITARDTASGALVFFSWGSIQHKDAKKRGKQLHAMQSYHSQKDLKKVKNSELNALDGEVLFWK